MDSNTLSIKLTIISIAAGFVFCLIFWLLNAEKFKRRFERTKIDFEAIQKQNLLGMGLTVINEDVLSDKDYLKKHNMIYWPVVPIDTPNTIHLAFINYIKYLSNAGLRTVVFVFDDYYRRIRKKGDSRMAKADSVCFINALKDMGLDSCNCKVIYESSYLKNIFNAYRMIEALRRIQTEITVKDMEVINNDKDHIKNETEYIRYDKPSHNMAYLSLTSNKYSFILSGQDEIELWKTYSKKVTDSSRYKLVNLFIPKMLGIKAEGTDVLDKEYNFTNTDDSKRIEDKVKINIEHLKDKQPEMCLPYALKYIYFANKKATDLRIPNDSGLDLVNYDHLLDHMLTHRSDAILIASLTKLIKGLFEGG